MTMRAKMNAKMCKNAHLGVFCRMLFFGDFSLFSFLVLFSWENNIFSANFWIFKKLAQWMLK